MTFVSASQSLLDISPTGGESVRAEVDVMFSVANHAVGANVGASDKADVTFLIRFSDRSYFGPVNLFPVVKAGALNEITIKVPGKDVEETFVFWKDLIGSSTVNRATSVSTNDRTMSARPSNIQVGWGLTTLQGIAYERAESSMRRFGQ